MRVGFLDVFKCGCACDNLDNILEQNNKISVKETKENITIKIPGLKQKEISIELKDGVLTIILPIKDVN